MSVLNQQHGGDHYKNKGIQPIQYIKANNLDFFQGNVIKYTTRHKDKNKAEDIKKAIHYLQMILEFDYGLKSTLTFESTFKPNNVLTGYEIFAQNGGNK